MKSYNFLSIRIILLAISMVPFCGCASRVQEVGKFGAISKGDEIVLKRPVFAVDTSELGGRTKFALVPPSDTNRGSGYWLSPSSIDADASGKLKFHVVKIFEPGRKFIVSKILNERGFSLWFGSYDTTYVYVTTVESGTPLYAFDDLLWDMKNNESDLFYFYIAKSRTK